MIIFGHLCIQVTNMAKIIINNLDMWMNWCTGHICLYAFGQGIFIFIISGKIPITWHHLLSTTTSQDAVITFGSSQSRRRKIYQESINYASCQSPYDTSLTFLAPWNPINWLIPQNLQERNMKSALILTLQFQET